MYQEGQISWPLLLATVVIVLTAMAAFQSADWSFDVAMRVFVEPMDSVMRTAWR